MISIVILARGDAGRVSSCLSGVLEQTTVDHEVILVLDSRSQVTDIAFENTNFRVVPAERCRNAAAALNAGAGAASGSHILFLASDSMVSRGWAANMLRCLQETGAGAVGPLGNLLSDPQSFPVVLRSPGEVAFLGRRLNRANQSRWFAASRIDKSALLIEKSLFDDVQGFDESLGGDRFIDDDLCLKIALYQKRLVVAGDAFVYRWGDKSEEVRDESNDIRRPDDVSWRRFAAKWGIDDISAVRPCRELLGFFDPKGKQVLDLRCRIGADILDLAGRGASLSVGIEKNRTLRKIAGALTSQVQGISIHKDLKTGDHQGGFDLVIANTFLESLADPQRVLKRVRGLIAPFGCMLAVVRNIRSMDRLVPLITGKDREREGTTYAPAATMSEVIRWFDAAGFEVLEATFFGKPYWSPIDDDIYELVKRHSGEPLTKEEYFRKCWVLARPAGSRRQDEARRMRATVKYSVFA